MNFYGFDEIFSGKFFAFMGIFHYTQVKYLPKGAHMIPKYQQIAEDLARRMHEDGFPDGKLPTEKELCGHYRVSRQTVRQALLTLEQEGLIMRRQGSGSYATGLRRQTGSNQIAVLLPFDSEYTYARLRSDLQKPLLQAGFSVSFFLTEYSVAKEREILEQLRQLPLAGLVADPVKNALPNPNLDLYEKLWASGLPTVFLQEVYDRFPGKPQVCTDSFGGAKMLANLLLSGKHTRIAGIFQQDVRSGPERYFGLVKACTDAGVPWDDRHIRWFSSRELLELQKKQVTGFLRDFIRQNLGTCSGVIVQNDEIAYWLIKELQHIGKNVPEDVTVVSFDNSYLCEISHPWITSLAPAKSPADAAVRLLLAQLRGQEAKSVTLPYTLVRRESDG
jgi:GntR family transcriptional regulator of arabinose operon